MVEAVNDVARAASQVQTLAEKNQHQAQIERDALRVVGLAQARFNAGIIAGSRVSEARIPALRERANGLLLQGQWLDASIQLTGALGFWLRGWGCMTLPTTRCALSLTAIP